MKVWTHSVISNGNLAFVLKYLFLKENVSKSKQKRAWKMTLTLAFDLETTLRFRSQPYFMLGPWCLSILTKVVYFNAGWKYCKKGNI